VAPCLGGKGQTAVQVANVCSNADAQKGVSLGNQHNGIDPNILNSGHHDCSKKALFFSAQLSNCNLATCWRIELSILGLLIQHSFEQRLQLFYQVLSWAGLGRILHCFRNDRKTLMSGVYFFLFPRQTH